MGKGRVVLQRITAHQLTTHLFSPSPGVRAGTFFFTGIGGSAEAGPCVGARGAKMSTVTAPAATRISPATNSGPTSPNMPLLVNATNVFTTGAPPNTNGMT